MPPFKLRQSANPVTVKKEHCGEQALSKSNQSNIQHYYLSGLSKITREIVKKSDGGNYIYRGEPEHYDKVSSSLYNRYPNALESNQFDLEELQKGTLLEARNHIRDRAKEDFEILTELQHFGSPTNLLDFTADFHIALFFACDGAHDKKGRIVLLKRTKEMNEKYRIEEPHNPQNRVIAQKSIFVRPSTGYIDPQDIFTVTVPRNLKQWILLHLWKFQDISTYSIYNDLHGFIRHRDLRSSEKALSPIVFADMIVEDMADENLTAQDEYEKFQKAIGLYTEGIQYAPYDAENYVKQAQCYMKIRRFDIAIETLSKAILLKPDYAKAYQWRALVHGMKNEPSHAIEDFTAAIQLNPNDARTYYTRGMVWLRMEAWEEAKLDLTAAKDKGHDIIASFHTVYPHVGDFKGRNESSLPEDIAAMLTS